MSERPAGAAPPPGGYLLGGQVSAPAVAGLIELIVEGFRAGGGDLNAGRTDPALLAALGTETRLRGHVCALEPGHPYLRLPLQFATSLKARLESIAGAEAVADLVRRATVELDRPGTWGTTFTRVQSAVRVH